MNDLFVFAIVIGVLLFGIFGYLVLMILFPESVGIQGELAHKHRREHEGDFSENKATDQSGQDHH